MVVSLFTCLCSCGCVMPTLHLNSNNKYDKLCHLAVNEPMASPFYFSYPLKQLKKEEAKQTLATL